MAKRGGMFNLALVGAVALTTSVIYYVHDFQTSERQRMKMGPIRDAERRKAKQDENDEKLSHSQSLSQSQPQSQSPSSDIS